MKNNLKNSIFFILIIVMLFLVVFISLAASKPSMQIDVKDTSISVYADKKISIGMVLYSTQTNYVDTLLANGFSELRIDIPDYQNTTWLSRSKSELPTIIAKGAKVIWGYIFKFL